MSQQTKSKCLVEVKSLKKYFPIEKGILKKVVGHVRAVDDVSFKIHEGETLGLVGESGCGKTTLGRCLLRIVEPTEGTVNFRVSPEKTVDVTKVDKKELRSLYRDMQMVFQDPFSSLDPRMTILDIVGEPLKMNKVCSGEEYVERVKELVQLVGLETGHLRRYPHAFSGGQRQRIGIARALALNPKFIVADEPVSALDVSVQAQILNLLKQLQKELNLAYLFIAHDLSVVEHISHRVGVMYVGKLVELASTEDLFTKPLHPYTEALLSAVPRPDPEVKASRIVLPGEIANPANPPSGCYFHPRCRYAVNQCKEVAPKWEEIKPGHYCACHRAKELDLSGVRETQSA
ncbi:MAG TPA: dipeptide ABC transporter ATP-binding protein [Firmicutes bacterium]|nr:dipeptide ABC transporter ATP-binding protein [Bacillota bacterium]